MPLMNRRGFLVNAPLLGLLGPGGLAHAADPVGRTRPGHLKLSLAAYSYRDYLTGPKKDMDLFGFLEIAADLALDAVEPTSYDFPDDVTPDHLHRLKRRAFVLGLDISGTAVMNDFCLPPGPEREKELAHVRTWIDRAAELDAPTIRVLSGNWIQGTPDAEVAKRVVDAIDSPTPEASRKGVTLALENHGGGVTTTAEELLKIVPDPDLNPIDLLPKGVEIRTPVCPSVESCLACFEVLHERMQVALGGLGYRAVALSHHPTEDQAAQGFDPAPLEPFRVRLRTGRLPADDLISLYEREQSIPAVLRHLARLVPVKESRPESFGRAAGYRDGSHHQQTA